VAAHQRVIGLLPLSPPHGPAGRGPPTPRPANQKYITTGFSLSPSRTCSLHNGHPVLGSVIARAGTRTFRGHSP
jgi:hypothetical protein